MAGKATSKSVDNTKKPVTSTKKSAASTKKSANPKKSLSAQSAAKVDKLRVSTAKSLSRKPAKPGTVLLSGGNPQISKADGDAPVQEYISAMPDWKRDVGRRLDSLIVKKVPNVRKAVRWNSPFYGIEGRGWFLSFHVFTRYVKVTFFSGTSLDPVPSGGNAKEARWIDIHDDGFDEAQMAKWIKQAAAIPGWGAS